MDTKSHNRKDYVNKHKNACEYTYRDYSDDTTDINRHPVDWRGRSDLILEAAELQSELEGENIPVQEYEQNGLQVTEIWIKTAKQEQSLGRICGHYITIYADELKEEDGGIHEEAVRETAAWIRKLLPAGAETVLVAGLGNAGASPDALGPDTSSHIYVNRHFRENPEYSKFQGTCESQKSFQVQEPSEQRSQWGKHLQVCAIAPGVLAQTGLETAGILAGITEKFKPDVLVVVDALAARSVTRLGTTIQITDTGISPGSGIGNHRQEISQKSLGIPVIAVGVPLVVEAAAIIYETVEAIRHALRQENMEQEACFLNQLSTQEQYELFRELLGKKAHPLYVTVKDVDEIERRLSFTLSEALNRAFSGMKSD